MGARMATGGVLHGSQMDAKYISLRPQNAGQERTKATFDCVVYLLYCSEHDKIAVNQVDTDAYWLPFVTRNGRSWKTAMTEGLQVLLETKDADGSLVRSVKLDAHFYPIELFRLQSFDLTWSQRMTQFVNIHTCNKTCEPTNNIIWLSAADLVHNCDAVFWGPEFQQHFTLFRDHPERLNKLEVVEQSEPVSQRMEDFKSTDILGQLFEVCNLTTEQDCKLYELYDAYLWHVYPAYYMGVASFRVFLHKFGFSLATSGCNEPDENALVQAIFGACLQRPRRSSTGLYIDFFDLSFALLSMDPTTPTEKSRIHFLFSVYDRDRSGYLEGEELDRLSADNGGVRLNGKMSFGDFKAAVQNQKLLNIKQVCRLPKSVVAKMAEAKKAQSELSHASDTKIPTKNKTLRDRSSCPNCRVKKFEYSKHMVTFDNTGCCVEPKIILNCDNPTMRTDLKGQTRHSMECAFNASSIGNVFFDLIRTRRILLLEREEEQQDFYERFKDLCEQVALFVKIEPKIVKRQSPAIVIGDINGHPESLYALEMAFWRSLPVLGDNIVFLGNYTGNGTGQCLETLAYLFSIKYLCPNKVLLLRGVQETKGFNEKTLLVECRSRLGKELGKQVNESVIEIQLSHFQFQFQVWNLVNDVFQSLPVMAIINESIVCASSGIPKESGKQRLGKVFENLAKDSVVFQQVATNMPDVSTEKLSSSKSKEQLFKPIQLLPNAYFFSHQAFKDFLQVNQFAYMIRSNDVHPDGFAVCFNKRLLTIITHVDGENVKQAIVILVTHPRGRIQLAQLAEVPASQNSEQQ